MTVLRDQIFIVHRLNTGLDVVLLVVVFFVLLIVVNTVSLLQVKGLLHLASLRVLIPVKFARRERYALKMRCTFLRVCHLT